MSLEVCPPGARAAGNDRPSPAIKGHSRGAREWLFIGLSDFPAVSLLADR